LHVELRRLLRLARLEVDVLELERHGLQLPSLAFAADHTPPFIRAAPTLPSAPCHGIRAPSAPPAPRRSCRTSIPAALPPCPRPRCTAAHRAARRKRSSR